MGAAVGVVGPPPLAACDDDALAAEINGASGVTVHVKRALVPTFHTACVSIVADIPEGTDADAVLKTARGVSVTSEIPTAEDAVGRDATIANLSKRDGNTVTIWLAMDVLRATSAILAVLMLERWIEK